MCCLTWTSTTSLVLCTVNMAPSALTLILTVIDLDLLLICHIGDGQSSVVSVD